LTVPVISFPYFPQMIESGRDSDSTNFAFLLSYKNIKGNAHKKVCSTLLFANTAHTAISTKARV
jgi:hypothetical protein